MRPKKSTLTKKHHSSIAYQHCSREAVAAGMVRVSKEHSVTNMADTFTKMMATPKKEELLDRLVFHLLKAR